MELLEHGGGEITEDDSHPVPGRHLDRCACSDLTPDWVDRSQKHQRGDSNARVTPDVFGASRLAGQDPTLQVKKPFAGNEAKLVDGQLEARVLVDGIFGHGTGFARVERAD